MATHRNSIPAVASRFPNESHRFWVPALVMALSLGLTNCAGPSSQTVQSPALERLAPADQRPYRLPSAAALENLPSDRPSEAPELLPADAHLDDYVRYAMRHNPELAAAFYRWHATLARIAQARTLPDPRISFAVVLDQVEKEAEYMGERYALEQMFPWFGKLALGGDMALTQAQAEARRFEATRLQLMDRVSRAYFEYAFRHQAVTIASENLDLLLRLEAVVRTMFRVGAAGLSDVSRAQIEIGRLDEQVRSLQDLVEVAGAELNTALGRPAQGRLPAPARRPSMQTASELPAYTDDHWLALARQHNLDLAAARQEAGQQRLAIELARKNYYPDFTVGIEYARDASARIAMMDGGGTDMLSGMVSINVPIWRKKYDAGLRESQARLDEANRQIQSLENRLETDLKLALFNHRDSQRKLSLYGDTLLPMARQTLATTETAYRAGNAGFSDLVDTQRVLLEFSLAHERAAADQAQAITRIQALVGRLIDDDPVMRPIIDGGSPPLPAPHPNRRQVR